MLNLPLHDLSAEHKKFLGTRIYAPTLLRRICQVCGVRLQMKDYEFVSHAPIFKACDVMNLDPITKTCEPKVLMGEINELVTMSMKAMKEEQNAMAYNYARTRSRKLNSTKRETAGNGVHIRT